MAKSCHTGHQKRRLGLVLQNYFWLNFSKILFRVLGFQHLDKIAPDVPVVFVTMELYLVEVDEDSYRPNCQTKLLNCLYYFAIS